jgi:hypothetical protein
MKKLRFDLYAGYQGDGKCTESLVARQFEDESDVEFLERVTNYLLELGTQLIEDREGDDDSAN